MCGQVPINGLINVGFGAEMGKLVQIAGRKLGKWLFVKARNAPGLAEEGSAAKGNI